MGGVRIVNTLMEVAFAACRFFIGEERLRVYKLGEWLDGYMAIWLDGYMADYREVGRA
jgi:hypothetical protein